MHDARDLDTFDRVFDIVFEGGALPTGRNARKSNKHQEPSFPSAEQRRREVRNQAVQTMGGVPWSMAPSASPDDDTPSPEDDNDMALPELLPAELAEIADQPFDLLSDDELAAIGTWLEPVSYTHLTLPTTPYV